ncbi:MAG: CPBP family intramembrane metalloprotease [Planctomycetaceae bacterium]|nr:CPBP family intramembrane metalloprotease [Planctomycetaceae bacterium]
MSFFWLAVLLEGGLAGVAVLADWLFRLGLNYGVYIWCDRETALQIVLGLLPLIVGYFVLLLLPLEGLQKVDRLVREFYWQYMRNLKLWQLAVIAALAGIGEELFFRGLIQMGLSNALGLDVWLAVLIASLLFGLAHAVTPTYFFLAFVISVYLGFLFVHTGNLFVPIAIHALYDLFVFLYIRQTLHRGTAHDRPIP